MATLLLFGGAPASKDALAPIRMPLPSGEASAETDTASGAVLLVVGHKHALAAASFLAPLGVSQPAMLAIGSGRADVITEYPDDCPYSVTLATLKQGASRNFGPLRSDLLHEIVQKHAPKAAPSNIVVVLEHEDQVVPAVLSVSRAFPLYYNKLKPQKSRSVHLYLVLQTPPTVPLNILKLQALVDACRDAAKLVDTPPNLLNPTTYTDIVRFTWESRLRELGVTLEIIQGNSLKEKGYLAIWNVGKASSTPPALVILSYKPLEPKKSVVWVGKGITFDTGGLSIKSKEGMPTMKTDMGGSAAVFEAFVATIRTSPPKNYSLSAILCIAENSVDQVSMRPDDIITSYSGKTIEVNNTDAEGRLVLCDGVAHACKHLNADVIVDMATLTGAQAYATGLRHGGVLSNSAWFENAVVEAGRVVGDLAYPLIFCPELISIDTLMKSDVADMKNSASDRSNAPATGAGMFIYAHLAPEDKWVENGEGMWAHVDMAYPVTVGNRGTGWGVGLLWNLSSVLDRHFSA
ncbi:putative aminopeptidase npepl1 [Entophlyctis sp. JEL0112]|nr:putative aminopeptidase npepl1 [Entophlyctis sp. JEL0112]